MKRLFFPILFIMQICISCADSADYFPVDWDEASASVKVMKGRNVKLWLGKYFIFNLMYVPTIFFMSELIFSGKMNGLAAVFFLIAGQAVLFIYDRAHAYFQGYIWGRLRTKLLGREYE